MSSILDEMQQMYLIIVEYMCCDSGKNTTKSLDGKADEDACDLGLTQFDSQWPEGAVDEECAQRFMECCVTVKNKTDR